MSALLDRFVSAPAWAMHEAALRAHVDTASRLVRASAAPVSADTTHAVANAPMSASSSSGGVAVLRVRGVIDQHDDPWLDYFGGTSTERLLRQFRVAMAAPEISAIVLDIHSPGGSVFGTPEAAAEIFAARGTKRIVAVASSFAASAAYWLAVAADEVVVTPSGEVGSIGCFMVHMDWSKALEEAGITPTIIRAGKYKAEGTPYEPLTDEAKDHRQAGVDRYHGMFLQAVAKYRGVSVQVVRDTFGEGRMLGAKDAKAAGMVDGIATLEETIARLLKTSTRRSGARAEGDAEDVAAEPVPATEAPADAAAPVEAPDASHDVDLRRRQWVLMEATS